MDDITEIEQVLIGLLRGEHSSLSLSFNGATGPNYMNVAEGIDDVLFNNGDWVSEEEKQKAIESNRAWTLQYYPDTPIGFYGIHACSLKALIEAVRSLPTEDEIDETPRIPLEDASKTT